MTTKIFSFALVFITSLTVSISAQTMAEKTFNKSFNTDGKGTLRLDLPGSVDMKIWDNPSIRFEISVSLPTGNGPMLDQLAHIGRYNLKAESVDDALLITAPNLQKQLKVKGQELKETLSFVVFIPKNMHVELVPNTLILADAKK
ncbi:MAG: hypothetical protein Q7U74_04735 [Saprospiraceae bacterium]|nr:hypothetical protein [Saprospiraceae bacterium]